MSSDIYFNARGETHHMRVMPVDEKPGGITVWEAMVDSSSYTYFEGHNDIDVWEIIELAVQAFLDYRVNETIEKIEWKEA